MAEDCCCDDPKSPSKGSPSLSGGGSSLPSKGDGNTGPGIMVIAGSRGVGADGSTPVAQPVGITPGGALKFTWEGQGKSGVLVNDNIRIVIHLGMIADWVISGSGNWSEE